MAYRFETIDLATLLVDPNTRSLLVSSDPNQPSLIPTDPAPLIVGFTGTREGMADTQIDHLAFFFGYVQGAAVSMGLGAELHHGGCRGADIEAANLFMSSAHLASITNVLRPGFGSDGVVNHKWRASIDEYDHPPAFTHPPQRFLKRNAHIVEGADLIIGCPKVGGHEALQDAKGGTGYTIRLAALAKKPLVIIDPSGQCFLFDHGSRIIYKTKKACPNG